VNKRTRYLVCFALLLTIVTAIFFSMAVSTYAATGIIRAETGKLKRFAYTGSLTTIKTGGTYFRDAGTYSNSMLHADGMPQPSGTVSGNIYYVDRNNNGVLDYGTDTVLYCLQYRKASPSGQSFSTEAYDAASSANLVAKDPWTYNGLLLILQNGFPVKTAAEMGLPGNDAAFYATASAVRFWLAQRERDLNLFPWHYNFLDLSRRVGTVRPIAGQEAVWNKAVQLRNLAVTNTGQRVSDVTAAFVGSDDYRYDWFIYQYRINTANMSGGYQITSTSLPAGSVITGYTGNNGDVLNVHIPFSEANAGKGFSFNVTAYDNAQAGSLEEYSPASGSSYQAVAGFNLKTVSNSKTISVSGATRAVPDLIVESMTTNKTSYDSGETGTLTLTVLNRGNGSTGYNSSLWVHTLGKGFTVGNIGSGQRASFSTAFSVPGPYTANTSYTLSASADNGNAVIESNEGNNDRSVSFTILGKPDLTVTSLTANKSVYEPGEMVNITATVLNNSSVACGAFDVRTRSNQLGEMNRVRWTSLAANTSRIYTYSFTAPNNYAADTVINLDFFADASFEISEFREDNNSALKNITVKAGKPDLTGSITTNKAMYEAGETVTASITVRNTAPVSVKGFNSQWSVQVGTQPTFAEGQLDQAATSSLPAGGSFTHTVTFTAPSVLTASNLRLDFAVDYDNRIAELDETNNLIQHIFAVNAVRPDLTVTDDNITAYFTGKEVVITATVRNLTLQPVPNATVRLVFGSITLNEQIPIPGNGSNLAVFRVRTPATAGSYTISMTVDPTNLISESNESNNSRSKSTTVAVENRIAMPDPDTVALEQSFISNGKKLPILSTPASSSYHTWQEYRLESGSYVLKNYWMRLTTTFTASPDPRIAIAGKQDVMESGFGLDVFATTSITTNYDRPDKLVGPQMLYSFYPETFFGQSPYTRYADSMATSSGNAGERTVSWCYPISPFSTVGSRLHFTPLWIPDGLYPVLAQAFYAWSPVGQVYEYKSDPVTILGDMYDRVTVVRR
jgi:subtilase family serine protease